MSERANYADYEREYMRCYERQPPKPRHRNTVRANTALQSIANLKPGMFIF